MASAPDVNPVIPVTVGNWNPVNRFHIPQHDAAGGIAGLPGNPGSCDPSISGETTGLYEIN